MMSSAPPSWTTARPVSSTATRTTPPPTRPWPAGPPRSSPPSARQSRVSPCPAACTAPHGMPACAWSSSGAPDAGLRGFAGVVGEVAWRAAERLFHAVGEGGVAAVQDGGEQVRDERHLVPGESGRGKPGGELLERDGGEPDRPFRGARDLADRIAECQQPRPGELVELTGVPVIEERFRGDLGDIVAVDEWLGDAIDGERDLTAEDRVEQECLAEVLREPAAAQDRPRQRSVLDEPLGGLGLRLT